MTHDRLAVCGNHPSVYFLWLIPRPAPLCLCLWLPCDFSQIAPEVLGISLWNLPYLSAQQLHTLCQKNSVPGHNRSAVSDVRVMSCSADFDQQKGLTGNATKGAVLKSTINCLIWYDVELVGLENCYLGLSKFWKFRKIFKKIFIFYLFSKTKYSPQNQNKKRSIY